MRTRTACNPAPCTAFLRLPFTLFGRVCTKCGCMNEFNEQLNPCVTSIQPLGLMEMRLMQHQKHQKRAPVLLGMAGIQQYCSELRRLILCTLSLLNLMRSNQLQHSQHGRIAEHV